ncbi:uncharacterized protein LOC101846228 [Aplysia californica]|uniref:Uncharacterized protein LOC101846228 n=1 Tax=Aplysia californica TaxID=6500 RepID=A0ABM0JXF2_APLCA|nr:uncharacterized protein LOC101846228 [Aplysia californica]
MAVEGSGDVNVFLSSSLMGCGSQREPQTTAAATTSSLLTFADMVLALDHKSTGDSFEPKSLLLDGSSESDHTYASNISRVTTRSRSQTPAQRIVAGLELQIGNSVSKLKQCHIMSDSESHSHSHRPSKEVSDTEKRNNDSSRVKRSSSVENIQCNSGPSTVSTSSEWPQVILKSSPRKSCSFEEFSIDHQFAMKSSKSSENIQRPAVSHQLHRVVNDTLEFPCWPRKADHTYATATWDGTAASHSLFEQELRQEADKPSQQVQEDQEMEFMEPGAQWNMWVSKQEGRLSSTETAQCAPLAYPATVLSQRDDHTYVKFKALSSQSPVLGQESHGNKIMLEETSTSVKHDFSSATFPRQKMRDDHTYFHSGLSKKGGIGSGGREWASVHTVMDISGPQASQMEEQIPSLHSFSRASAKKDHNYSTSA